MEFTSKGKRVPNRNETQFEAIKKLRKNVFVSIRFFLRNNAQRSYEIPVSFSEGEDVGDAWYDEDSIEKAVEALSRRFDSDE